MLSILIFSHAQGVRTGSRSPYCQEAVAMDAHTERDLHAISELPPVFSASKTTVFVRWRIFSLRIVFPTHQSDYGYRL